MEPGVKMMLLKQMTAKLQPQWHRGPRKESTTAGQGTSANLAYKSILPVKAYIPA